ncbi:MAG: ESPR domain-containing protein, partial [Nevskiaceae bacterium]|nr:ESPR domain-containing protein [Nevskiaceae bacterium]
MNHQYKTVFNRKLGVLQVVSELKRACGKVGGSARSAPVVAAVALGLSVLGGAPVLASECDLADGTRNSGTPADSGDTCTITGYTPQANDNQVGSAYANNGDTINFVADSTARIAQGRSGLENTTYGALNSGIAGLINLNLGSQSLSVSTSDPITQGNVTVAAYNSNNFAQTDWGDASIAALVPVADDQYIDARFGTAEGGTVNVDIGGSDAAPLATGHSLNMVIKQTYLAAAQGADSTVNWTSRNQTSWVVNTAAAEGEDTLLVASYAGSVTFKDVTYEVTDAASLADYNNALIDALRDNSFPLAAGQSPQDAYNSAFNAAVTLQEQDVNWTITLPSGDDGLLPRGDYYAILADGAGATGRITGSGQLDGAGYAALAKNGGLFEIEAGGRLSVRANGLVPAVVINTGGQGVNKGVIGSGYWIGDNLNTVNAATNLFGDAAAVNVDGVGSRFINEGIINVAASNDAIVTDNGRGFVLNNGATGINTGVINVGVNADSTSSGTTSGVLININNQGGSFTNEAGGLIYIGRAAQYTVGAPEEVPDVANNVIQYGIRAGGGQAVNEGNIVIGTLTQNATGVGVPAFNGPQARITNAATGAITIHGAVDGGLQNIGMFATDTGATITNAGTIMLDGTNAVALKAMGLGDRNTLVTHSGTISMEGGLDTQGLRNYGIWAEGARATANLVAGGNGDGVVNLNGDGAIGVHARNGGTINIGAGAKGVVFGSGENQIGFFTYGTGSSITNNGSAPLDVSTDFSTLFRVEAGADFTGAIKPAIDENNQVVLDGRVIDVSGARATGVVMTGFTDVTTNGVTTRDVSALTANAALVNITGEGGVALKVEGGAQVLLSNLPPTDPALLDPANPALAGLEPVTATTAVNMRAAGAVAAIVDGQGYDLQGESTGDIQPGAFNMNSLEKQPDGSYRPLTPAGYAGAAAAINPVIGLPVAVQDPPLFGTGTILATAALVNTPVDSETQIAYPDLTAYIVRNQAELVSFGDINMLGVNNTGILVESAGHLVNLKDVTVRNGQGVIIDGAGPTVDGVVTPSRFYNDGVIYAQDGTAALLLRNGALLESDADAGGNTGGIGTLRAGGNADGVRIAAAVADPDGDGPLQGSDPVLGVRLGANTILLDENSAGAGVNNVGEISAVSFAGTVIEVNGGVGIRTATSFVDPEGAPKSNPTINVIGNGTGILFQSLNPVGRSPGPPSPNAYSDFSDAYQINVTGAGGTGIVADARGSVTNLPSATVDNVAGGSALVLGTQVTVASNGGDLISNSAAAPTVRANAVNPFTFTNTGTISNTSAPGDGPSGGIALLMANDATVNIGDPTDTTDAGTVIGAIQLADGTNSVLLTDGSSVTEVVSNGGTDTVTIRGAVAHDTSNRFASLVGSATGMQTLVFDSADYTLADPAAIRNYDQVNLRNASTFTLQQVLAGDPGGGAAIDVESGSTLEIIPDPSGPYTL